MTPETKARQEIDQRLIQAGWVVQDMKELNLAAGVGVAIREYPTDSGPADYVLFVKSKPVGIIEAKRNDAGATLTMVEQQTERYAVGRLKWFKDHPPLPFLFEATGQLIRFTEARYPLPRSRALLLTEASGSPAHVGRPVIWPTVDGLYCFQNTVLRFTPQGIRSAFAFRLFHAWQKLGVFSKLAGGVGINHLSAGKFSKLTVPLPSLTEQDACVRFLESAFTMLIDQEECILHATKQATAQRKNILKAAFAGQLVPQDPNDEPASGLLARIRDAREARAGHAAQAKVKKPRASKA